MNIQDEGGGGVTRKGGKLLGLAYSSLASFSVYRQYKL